VQGFRAAASMIQRSPAFVDDQLGRLVPGRAHIFVGGPGTGKTTLCLRFIAEGLTRGESAAMLVSGRGSDIKAHASHLSFDLNDALRKERLILFRYRADFAQRIGNAPAGRSIIDDFERLIAPIR